MENIFVVVYEDEPGFFVPVTLAGDVILSAEYEDEAHKQAAEYTQMMGRDLKVMRFKPAGIVQKGEDEDA